MSKKTTNPINSAYPPFLAGCEAAIMLASSFPNVSRHLDKTQVTLLYDRAVMAGFNLTQQLLHEIRDRG